MSIANTQTPAPAASQSAATRAPGGFFKTLDEIGIFVWRSLAHIPRVPERLADVTVMPIMFVLLFGYVFGSAIALPGMELSAESSAAYREYLISGIFVQSMAFMSITTAVGVVGDMREGVIDRFRSLPITRSSLLVGRSISTLIEGFLGIFIMALCGLLVGWAVRTGFWDGLAGFALLAFFAFAMISIGIYIGQIVRNPMTAQVFGFVFIFPLTFASNAFVATQNMPGPLKTFAEYNPVSAVTQAMRDLFGNNPPFPGEVVAAQAWPLQNAVLASLLWCAAITVIGLTLAVLKYSKNKK